MHGTFEDFCIILFMNVLVYQLGKIPSRKNQPLGKSHPRNKPHFSCIQISVPS